jgi:hypothetical protein
MTKQLSIAILLALAIMLAAPAFVGADTCVNGLLYDAQGGVSWFMR